MRKENTMTSLKQLLQFFIIGLAGGILLYVLVDSLIGFGLTLAVLYVIYNLMTQNRESKGGQVHD